MPRDVAVVIAAGGESRRMKGAVRKPFLDLGGRPIIGVTLEKFAAERRICQVIVAVHESDERHREGLLAGEYGPGVTDVVIGGLTRTDTVANALEALTDDARIVLVHDAVRPFVWQEVIEAVISAAGRSGAAIAAVPIRDTIKRVESGSIVGTVPREGLYLAQTPQGFKREVIERAYADRAGRDYSDDALLVEIEGGRVEIVESSYENFKITTAEDLEVARAIVSFSGGQQGHF